MEGWATSCSKRSTGQARGNAYWIQSLICPSSPGDGPALALTPIQLSCSVNAWGWMPGALPHFPLRAVCTTALLEEGTGILRQASAEDPAWCLR